MTTTPGGKPAFAQYTSPRGWTYGPTTGNINGRNISFTAHWNEGPGAGGSNTYTGIIHDDGTASGTTVNFAGVVNAWHSVEGRVRCHVPTNTATAKSKDCNGKRIDVNDPCPEAAKPPSDAVEVTFDRGFGQWTVNVENTADIPGKCTYTATSPGLPTVTKAFDIAAKGKANFQVVAPLPFTTWHVVTVCTGVFNGTQVEFGHDEQDISV